MLSIIPSTGSYSWQQELATSQAEQLRHYPNEKDEFDRHNHPNFPN